MKCKRHPQEQGAGVCASCLRDRLLTLQAELNGASSEIPRRNPPPPVLLPRSASYSRSVDYDTASDASDPDPHRRGRRFYHTPQAGDRRSERGRSGGCKRFHLFSSLFHHHHHHDSGESEACASSSWFSFLIHGGRRRNKKKKPRTVLSPPPPSKAGKMRSYAVSDRGMSPVRYDETDDNASDSGYSTESSAAWRRPTPARRAAAERHRKRGGGIVGFTVCLSPLARPGPSSRRSQPSDLGFSGDLRANGNPAINRHVSGACGSFGPNRSRKLADRGRFR